ncbi:MAG: large subunit ribosomal protein L22 [Verrucomicrobiales bacterium]|jgi:large subunit ribosomal protein L22
MTGAKTNERPGTRASVKHVRASAYKAREVLNEIRGLHVTDAADYLELCERGIAEPVGKLLDAAVANAEHNDLQDAEELFVSACYADEGPTMKRWRPRARGRATRIRKRTCHITLIVSRLDDDKLEVRRNRAERRAAGGAAPKASRAARVARSKGTDEVGEDIDEVGEDTDEVGEGSNEATDGVAAPKEGDHPHGDGSHAPLDDVAEMPEGYPVKGNADSGKFHQPNGRWYENTVAEVWFADAAAAEGAGFIEAGTKAKTADTEEEE